MKNLFLTLSFLLTSTLSFAGNTPFVTCNHQNGHVIDSVELEAVKDRYGREQVKATLTYLTEEKVSYIADMPLKKVFEAVANNKIDIGVHNAKAAPKWLSISIIGSDAAVVGRGTVANGGFNCEWIR